MQTNEIINNILEINNYTSLNPVQEKATKYISKDCIVCSPTASGKTTIFELQMLDCVTNKKQKIIYISPLKALTSEHYKETKRKFSKKFNLKIGISIGDFDSSVKHLENYDVLFMTYEKLDSVIRHSPSWLNDVGLLTIDEIHELGGGRGATLEVLITQIRHSYKQIKILGLSATIGNAKELSNWLGANLIESNYRPVPLENGVFYNNQIYFEDHKEDVSEFAIKNINIASIIIDTIKKNKQAIVFCNSRKNTMSFASKFSKIIKKYLSEKENKSLTKNAKEALEVLEQPTDQCILLSNAIANGVGFHHAGLLSKQREIVEDEFKKGNLKVIFATPTLAAGINLPAYRVIINSVFRYQNNGMVPIPVNEYQQMAGRAGRPKYDTCGQAISVVNSENNISKVYNAYITATPTNIDSQLSKTNLLRIHLLSMIFINNIKTEEELIDYFSKTFYNYIFGDVNEIKVNISEIIREFKNSNFLKNEDNKLEITKIGRKVCYLYIDPLSAHNIISDLEIKKDKKLKDIELIYTLINTTEMYPYIRYKPKKEDEIFNIFEIIKNNIYFEYEDMYLLSKIYESKMIEQWIGEIPENKIINEFNTTPGQIREIISRLNWVVHSVTELIKETTNNIEQLKDYKDLELRLKYGINKELIPLVRLKNIGRVRARKLYNLGIKNIGDIKNKKNKFIEIIGKIGFEVLKELKIDIDTKDIKLKKNKIQKRLLDY